MELAKKASSQSYDPEAWDDYGNEEDDENPSVNTFQQDFVEERKGNQNNNSLFKDGFRPIHANDLKVGVEEYIAKTVDIFGDADALVLVARQCNWN